MTRLCDECETVAHCLKHGCIPKQSALDKKAENARELGLDYEPAQQECRCNQGQVCHICDPILPAQQEPVAWVCNGTNGHHDIDFFEEDVDSISVGTQLYTSPPAQRKPLTDEELYKVFPAIATYTEANKTLYRSIARAIEAAHGIKEKNNG